MSKKDQEKTNNKQGQNDSSAGENMNDELKNNDKTAGGPNGTPDPESKEIKEEGKDQTQQKQEPSIDEDPKDIMIKELEAKNREINEKYLRLFSEFDNFRKRSLKEKIELTKTASAEITEAILPVLDDLQRAQKSAAEDQNTEALKEGINLINTKLQTTLKQKGLEEIPTVGEEFNTDFHEAITHIPAKDKKEKGKVIEEIQKGYTLNGKILRFAKVVVAN